MPSDSASARDHGGRLDAAIAEFGGSRAGWLDLSTGINPVPYPVPQIGAEAWTALPDHAARTALTGAARTFWSVPEGAAILATPGASAPIAMIPRLLTPGRVHIPGPTYNEHEAAFRAAGWSLSESGADARVLVHPNNPDGRWHEAPEPAALTVIDESFCDIAPERSLIAQANSPGTLILKSFGKFWGLAGLRLGFVIGDPELVGRLATMLGPWPVSGPALQIGTAALRDHDWAETTRARLSQDAARLDQLMTATGATLTGGTPLFRLYDHPQAPALYRHLARHHILTRPFPWSATALRLGLPHPDRWDQLSTALSAFR
ncbi:threonine-phosphate decarboxylase [Pseudooceanicola sp. C21-150M6]|uniref:threonine-phosphate decarboxylase n=1 Tax=Pseudooceanicola sp. C21-150M6 TaxID=3434355 RepID=UPI003D7F9B03